MMAAQKRSGAAEVEQLRRMCSDLQTRNAELQAQLHVGAQLLFVKHPLPNWDS
jgi:hypothetical protein